MYSHAFLHHCSVIPGQHYFCTNKRKSSRCTCIKFGLLRFQNVILVGGLWLYVGKHNEYLLVKVSWRLEEELLMTLRACQLIFLYFYIYYY